MVDLKKEIKLSQLVPKPRKKGGSTTGGTLAAAPRAKKSKKTELVGLKIGSSQIAAARVVNNGGKPRLLQLARTTLEPGIVVNGEVRNVNGLAKALDDFFTEHKLPRKGVRLGIGTNRVGVRVVDVEGASDSKQLGNAVMFRANETLSIPMDQAILDYHVVGEKKADDGSDTTRVLLAAAYREPIDQFVTACHVAHVDLVGIDVEAFALLRAVADSASPQDDSTPAAVVAVNVGHDRSILAISDGTICDFTRVLDWGGARIDMALSRDLGLTDEETLELKQSLSLEDDAQDGAEVGGRVEKARECVKKELGTLARELVASLQFYQSQPESLPIAEILVTGGTSRLPGFAEELERLVRARVRVADPVASVAPENPAVTERDDLSSLTVAIGLGVDR